MLDENAQKSASRKFANTDNISVLTRRKMLTLLAAAGSSLLASTPSAKAFFNFFEAYSPAHPSKLTALDIPPEWLPRLGNLLPTYIHFLQTLKLKHVNIKKLIQPHTKSLGGVANTLPPKQLWRNIRNTLNVIDGLAQSLELSPSEYVSVYRSPAYNAKCRGAKSNSYHLRNNAIDIKFPCPPGKVTAMAKEMRAAGLFRGGIGRYRSFTHVDTRGKNSDWSG